MKKEMYMEALKRKMIQAKGGPVADQEYADGMIEGDALLDEEKKQRGETDLAPKLLAEEKETMDEAAAEAELGEDIAERDEAEIPMKQPEQMIDQKVLAALADKSVHGRHASSLGERAASHAKAKLHELKKKA